MSRPNLRKLRSWTWGYGSLVRTTLWLGRLGSVPWRTKLTMKPVDGHDQDPAAAKLAIQCPRRSGQYYRRVRPTRFHASPKHLPSEARDLLGWRQGRAVTLPERHTVVLGARHARTWRGGFECSGVALIEVPHPALGRRQSKPRRCLVLAYARAGSQPAGVVDNLAGPIRGVGFGRREL